MSYPCKTTLTIRKILLISVLASGCAHNRPSADPDPNATWQDPPAAGTAMPGFSDAAVAVSTAAAENGITEQDIRDLEEGEGSGLAVFISSAPPEPPPPVNLGGNGRLTMTRQDTGEKLTVAYRGKNGEYDPKALAKLNTLMRCSLDGSEIEMSVKLIELLDAVEDKFGKKGLTLLSGYRTSELNRSIKGAAEHSLHMLGWAADIKIPGYSSTKVQKYARKLAVGGVGYYPSKGFTHLDVGKVRYWVVKRQVRKHRRARKKTAARASPKSAPKKHPAARPSAKKSAKK